MIRHLLVALLAGLVGAAGGAFGWHAFGPLFFDRVANEALPPEFSGAVLARGTFRDVDRTHKGSGSARLMRTGLGTTFLRLEGFAVTNGPSLEIWLSEAAAPKTSGEVRAAGHLSLGPLRGNRGDQTYLLPRDVDLARYRAVVIWCEEFSVLFSAADLG